MTRLKVTQEDIDNCIVSEQYHLFENTTLMVCALVLRNGFVVTGESACASAQEYDEGVGKSIAFQNAKNKIWALEGYLLKEELNKSNAEDTLR